MKHYYVNTNEPKGRRDEQVHASWCPLIKEGAGRNYVGLFADARKAVSVAQEMGYARACGCSKCCPETLLH